MDRILVNTPGTISATWYSGGTIVTPGSVTVVITRADGTQIVSASALGSGAAPRTYNLTTTHTSLLDTLKAVWTSTTLGSLTTYHEVVGDFLFTISDGLAQFTGSTAAQVAVARTRAEQDLEDACGVAFVPRYDRELLSGERLRSLLLRRRFIRRVRAVSVDGVALTAPQLADVIPDGNVIFYENGFTRGIRNVAVDYEHGFDYPPVGADRAALALAETYFSASGGLDLNNPRLIAASAGEESFKFASTLGVTVGRFGIAAVDNFVAANDYRVIVG